MSSTTEWGLGAQPTSLAARRNWKNQIRQHPPRQKAPPASSAGSMAQAAPKHTWADDVEEDEAEEARRRSQAAPSRPGDGGGSWAAVAAGSGRSRTLGAPARPAPAPAAPPPAPASPVRPAADYQDYDEDVEAFREGR